VAGVEQDFEDEIARREEVEAAAVLLEQRLDAETRALREELDDLRGAYNDMRAMGLPDVLKAQAVLDAALAWEKDMTETMPFRGEYERMTGEEEVLYNAIRAYRADL
jgi:hypothetical protein